MGTSASTAASAPEMFSVHNLTAENVGKLFNTKRCADIGAGHPVTLERKKICKYKPSPLDEAAQQYFCDSHSNYHYQASAPGAHVCQQIFDEDVQKGRLTVPPPTSQKVCDLYRDLYKN